MAALQRRIVIAPQLRTGSNTEAFLPESHSPLLGNLSLCLRHFILDNLLSHLDGYAKNERHPGARKRTTGVDNPLKREGMKNAERED